MRNKLRLRLILCVFLCVSGLSFAALESYHSFKSIPLSEDTYFQTNPYANPAYMSVVDDFSFRYGWTNTQQSMIHLGLPVFGVGFFQDPNYGFTRTHWAWGEGTEVWGSGFLWGTNALGQMGLTSQFGYLNRLSAFFSVGASGMFEMGGDSDKQGVFELGYRPDGTDYLTIGVDCSIDSRRSSDWSVFSTVKPIPGIGVGVKYFGDKTVILGVELQFGGSSVALQGGLTSVPLNSGVRSTVLQGLMPKPSGYLRLKLGSNIAYQRYSYFDDSQTLYGILEAIRLAKDNPRIHGISLDLSTFESSFSMAWEIRAALSAFKAKGKKVVVFLQRPDYETYYLGSVGDWVVLDPLGSVEILGESYGSPYLKGALDKLGIGCDELRFFKYKSAYEFVSRDKMSDADREQRDAILKSNYHILSQAIMTSRRVSENVFESWMNTFPQIRAVDAKSLGVVDQLGRAKEVDAKWASWNMGSQEVSSRVLIPIKNTSWKQAPIVAVVYAIGECALDSGIKGRQLAGILSRLVEDSDVKAIVVRVDSPGGDGLASDLVAEEIRKGKLKKPIIISQGDVAASGGYWLSMYGTRILATPFTHTGSIGVISRWFYNKGLKEWTGLSTDQAAYGKYAGIYSGIRIPFIGAKVFDRPLSEDERKLMEQSIRVHYGEFVQRVATGRGKKVEDIESVAQGRVWSGDDGLRQGLIDQLGGLDIAIQLAKKEAGIRLDERVDIISAPEKGFVKWPQLGLGSPLELSVLDDIQSVKDILNTNAQIRYEL